MDEIDFDSLSKAVLYDPDSGKLFWKRRPENMFREKSYADRWNKRYAGKEAFVQDHPGGYKVGVVFYKSILAHRVAWMLYYGEWPSDMIDHINGVKTDNRIKNLRQADMSKNKMNVGLTSANTSGYKGVSWCKRTGKWRASITLEGKYKSLGYYFTPDEAHCAYRKAAEVLHGEFHRHK